uniref:RNA-directed DNA polymerase n=1 Tax=Macrostomum lignano TaxID=282301 RepID=A0A1I8JNT3_9PLAT
GQSPGQLLPKRILPGRGGPISGANVRDSKSLELLQSFACADQITDLAWSPDSLCGSLSTRLGLQKLTKASPVWSRLLGAGQSASADTADFNLRKCITDFRNGHLGFHSAFPIPNPLSSDGCLLALAERRGLKDCVSVFNCRRWTPCWQLVAHFDAGTRRPGRAWPALERAGHQVRGVVAILKFLAVRCYDGSTAAVEQHHLEPLGRDRGADLAWRAAAILTNSLFIRESWLIEKSNPHTGLPRYEPSPPVTPPIRHPGGESRTQQSRIPKWGSEAVHFSPCYTVHDPATFRRGTAARALVACGSLQQVEARVPCCAQKISVRSFCLGSVSLNPPKKLDIVTELRVCIHVVNRCCLPLRCALMDALARIRNHQRQLASHDGDALLLTSDATACVCFLESAEPAGQAWMKSKHC